MALVTINPTSFTNPDPSGGLAVTGAGNLGHSSTTSTASGGTDSQTKSCLWTGFPAGPSIRSSATLKVDYTRNGTLSDGGLNTFNEFLIQYSLNGGSSFSNLLDDQFVTSSSSSTASVSIANSQDLTQVRVRDFLTAQKTGGASATMVAAPSNIRIEIVSADIVPVVMV